MSDDLFREIDKLATKLPTWLQPDDAQLVCQKSLKGTWVIYWAFLSDQRFRSNIDKNTFVSISYDEYSTRK